MAIYWRRIHVFFSHLCKCVGGVFCKPKSEWYFERFSRLKVNFSFIVVSLSLFSPLLSILIVLIRIVSANEYLKLFRSLSVTCSTPCPLYSSDSVFTLFSHCLPAPQDNWNYAHSCYYWRTSIRDNVMSLLTSNKCIAPDGLFDFRLYVMDMLCVIYSEVTVREINTNIPNVGCEL